MKRKMCLKMEKCYGNTTTTKTLGCPRNTNSRCEIVPKKLKMVRVLGTMALWANGTLVVYTNKKVDKEAFGAPCTILIEAKYLKGRKA